MTAIIPKKWLSRDLDGDAYNFHSRYKKPECDEDGDYDDYIYCMHEDAFKAMYPDIDIEPGECKEIKHISLELI